MNNTTLVIGTRGSKLALWQANWVREQLEASKHQVEIRAIKTSGDSLQAFAPEQPIPASMAEVLAKVGSKGLFIKEIEEALLAGELDIAVHSYKDLPTEHPAGLTVAAVAAREDARDVYISRDGTPFRNLTAGARVGTGSPRRQTQLWAIRPDLQVEAIRGNLDTRLRKLDAGEYDALVVAAAGVHRLGQKERITSYFTFDEMCPAVGQGALALQVRKDDEKALMAVAPLNDKPTQQAVRAERAVLRRLGGGCQVPIAAHAVRQDAWLHLWGLVANLDGTALIRAQATGPAETPEHLGNHVAKDLLRQGAQGILATIFNR